MTTRQKATPSEISMLLSGLKDTVSSKYLHDIGDQIFLAEFDDSENKYTGSYITVQVDKIIRTTTITESDKVSEEQYVVSIVKELSKLVDE